ncbi:hypothetical protein K435DRAFT_30207 [Dendrothele bispora CBS 962.96]|uniref:Uncharacterized protein n=1 Tax=Dendrothele bispora (strain CBS 962.96) TaxID=1314807 RepID=A0A4S8KTR7_DENBC|nr:hypothetical protein K435DRAFT_30207 [Dendrothele bispora CBS 962.96]
MNSHDPHLNIKLKLPHYTASNFVKAATSVPMDVPRQYGSSAQMPTKSGHLRIALEYGQLSIIIPFVMLVSIMVWMWL